MAGHPGYWREADQSSLTPAQATAAWAEQAPDILKEVAASYGGLIDYAAFADEVQTRSGVRTRVPVMSWIGPVLRSLMQSLRAAGEPPLTALVVPRIDASVGGPLNNMSRLQCYARYAGPLPEAARAALAPPSTTRSRASSGARASSASRGARASSKSAAGASGSSGSTERAPGAVRLSTQAAAGRGVSARAEEAPVTLCPRCFIALPLTGVCDNCG